MEKIILHILNFLRGIYRLLPIPKNFRKFISTFFVSRLIWLRSFYRAQYYKHWLAENGYDSKGLEKQRNTEFPYSPKISIVIPMYNAEYRHFEELISSIKFQTYENWEICIADGSDEQDSRVKNLAQTDDRIKYTYLENNKGISENTNEAMKLATGDYIGFMDHDDLLPAFSLFEIIKLINEKSKAEFIYTDETHYYETKKRSFHSPHLKPCFSPDYLRSVNYICHFTIIKKDLAKRVGELKSEYDGAQDHDFALRASEITDKIYHIPKLLYHWRIHDESYSKADMTPSREAGKRAIEHHLKRLGLSATVRLQKETDFYDVEYEVIGNPSVSIVIPNKDQVKLLKNCIDSIIKLTTYDNYEIIIVENNSEENATFDYYRKLEKQENQQKKTRVLMYPDSGFNYSKLINYGVKNSKSDYILQLNNDTVLLTPNWLELMLGYAQRPDVGAVGARLYFADNTIQHAGVAVPFSPELPCGHVFVLLPKGEPGYMARTETIMNYRAVTGACLMCRRELYEKVGYMDEGYAKAYGDADLCMKFIALGLVNVYNPLVELMHYESKTRRYDNTRKKKIQFKHEGELFKKNWEKQLKNGDPYYNTDILKLR